MALPILAKNLDLAGQVFGRWTVLRFAGKNKRGTYLYDCQCLCGNQRIVVRQSLLTGLSKSCGCLKRELAEAQTRIPHFEDLTGQRFGRWTVKEYRGLSRWLCLCDCGRTSIVVKRSLKKGLAQSCGCLPREQRTKHGLSKSPEYLTWIRIKRRCYDKTHDTYLSYGGKGIKVCARWLNSFENFYEDMGPRPSENHSIDRYPDPRGDYEPANCRWATSKEQGNNKTNNRRIVCDGELLTVAQAARKYGMSASTLRHRLESGIPAQEAVKMPRNREATLAWVSARRNAEV